MGAAQGQATVMPERGAPHKQSLRFAGQRRRALQNKALARFSGPKLRSLEREPAQHQAPTTERRKQ